MIILLLVVQAYCDLSLPSYTSDIVDVGIEQGGIEHEAMEEMRKESFDTLCFFVEDKDEKTLRDAYKLDEKTERYVRKSDKKEDIENLAVGDKITFHEEGAAWNQVVNDAVTSIEKNDEYHLVSINGGMEQPGGLDLKLEDDDTYRTMTFDDYPLYYEMGEKKMPLAEDVVLKDSSADPQAEAVETTGADAVAAAINADPDNWTTYNTTLVVQGGKVLEVRRIWVP